jgi:hypothetical protein
MSSNNRQLYVIVILELQMRLTISNHRHLCVNIASKTWALPSISKRDSVISSCWTMWWARLLLLWRRRPLYPSLLQVWRSTVLPETCQMNGTAMVGHLYSSEAWWQIKAVCKSSTHFPHPFIKPRWNGYVSTCNTIKSDWWSLDLTCRIEQIKTFSD